MSVATAAAIDVSSVLRPGFSDAELETAAAETALSYTYQTSEYATCCD